MNPQRRGKDSNPYPSDCFKSRSAIRYTTRLERKLQLQLMLLLVVYALQGAKSILAARQGIEPRSLLLESSTLPLS